MPYLTPDPAAAVELPAVNTDWPVVARLTVIDGLCIEWYKSVDAYRAGAPYRACASRNGVLICGNLLDIPDTILDQARRAHSLLAARTDTGRDLAEAMATHRSVGRTRNLQPINPPTTKNGDPS